MFGYVHANKTELSESDQIDYQRYYCGLCQQLKELNSFKGQMLLNYDLCFLAILLSGLYEPATDTHEFRCIVHPVSAKHAYNNEATEYAAAMDILLSYHNLMDKYHDDGSQLAKLAANGIKDSYDSLSRKYPRQAHAIEQYIDSLSKAEAAHEDNIDIVSNYTGEMLSVLFQWRDDSWAKELKTMGFYLGKFIYIMDSYDDMDRDEKSGSYNPLLKLRKDSPQEFETFIRGHMTCLMGECAKSFERLPIVEHASILRNIIYSGVWSRYEYLQLKKNKNKEKTDA